LIKNVVKREDGGEDNFLRDEECATEIPDRREFVQKNDSRGKHENASGISGESKQGAYEKELPEKTAQHPKEKKRLAEIKIHGIKS